MNAAFAGSEVSKQVTRQQELELWAEDVGLALRLQSSPSHPLFRGLASSLCKCFAHHRTRRLGRSDRGESDQESNI